MNSGSRGPADGSGCLSLARAGQRAYIFASREMGFPEGTCGSLSHKPSPPPPHLPHLVQDHTTILGCDFGVFYASGRKMCPRKTVSVPKRAHQAKLSKGH